MKSAKRTIDLTSLLTRAAELVRSRAGALPDVASERTQGLRARIENAKAVPSVCPYCAVGCATLAYVDDGGKLLDVEGNPDSPVNAGHLCPKGSASFGLTVNSARWTTAKYRAPYSTTWEDRPLEWVMEQVAQRIKKTRDETFVREKNGKRVNHTLGLATLGGATFAIEENYLLGKLFHALGVVSIENQARI
jgi:formate dehydrogenase major subunit